MAKINYIYTSSNKEEAPKEIKYPEFQTGTEFERMQNIMNKKFSKEMRNLKDLFETLNKYKNNDHGMWSNQEGFWEIRRILKSMHEFYLQEVDEELFLDESDRLAVESFRKHLKGFYLDSKILVGKIARDFSPEHMDSIRKFLNKYNKYLGIDSTPKKNTVKEKTESIFGKVKNLLGLNPKKE